MSAQLTAADVVVLVPTYDRDGNMRTRGLSVGCTARLYPSAGQGDRGGLHVWACPACGDLAWLDGSDGELLVQQDHYRRMHGFVPALLP